MSDRAPTFSVCVRAYRDGDGLRRALASILGQTFADLEVVVSDDGGLLEEVVRAAGDPRVRYLRNTGARGPAGNLVSALSAARGELVAIVNEDDALEPGFLEAAEAVLSSDPEVGVVFAPNTWEAGERRRVVASGLPSGKLSDPCAAILQDGMPACGVALRREVWTQGEAATPLREGMVGDATLWLRAARDGWAFYGLREPMARFRLHPGQVGWRADYPERMLATLDAFAFADRAAERLRRARVSELLATRAGSELRRGQLRPALRTLRAAARTSPSGLGVRHLIALVDARAVAYRQLSRRPRLLFGLLRVWGRVRPRVA
jgi:glycosyltransferase involved in cell wall biosynthesis